MRDGFVQIEVEFGTDHPPSFMIERVFDHYIGGEWRKWERARDMATIYEVPKQWETWWRFWLAPSPNYRRSSNPAKQRRSEAESD